MRGTLRTSLVTAAVAAGLVTTGAAQPGAVPFGLWEHPENGSRIELFACGEDVCARIKRISDGQTRDQNNPDPGLRQRPILGLMIVAGARKTGPRSWAGTIYNRIDGREYDGRIALTKDGKLQLTGCTAVIVCRTVVWTRVDERLRTPR